MPGLVLTTGAVVTCAHQGSVVDTPAQVRVLIHGQPVATSADQFAIMGCPGVTATGIPPCTTVRWTSLSTSVFANRSPVLLQPVPPSGPVPGGGVAVNSPPVPTLVYAVQLTVTAR
jgi:hypothetical protein